MIGILQIFSLAYIVLFLSFLLMGTIRPMRISRIWYLLALIFAISLAIIAYCLEPHSRLDLYRLQQGINEMRLSTDTAWGKIYHGAGNYEGLILFNLICYIVSLLPNNHWLQVISIMITCPLLFTVTISFLRSEKHTTRMLFPALLMIFMGLPMQHVFSGIRNAMAIALAITALYLLYYKKKLHICALLMLVLSVTVHPAILVLFPVLLLYRGKRQMLWRILALATLPVVFFMAEQLLSVPISFVQNIASRIIYYRMRVYMYNRPEMIANITMFVVIGGGYWILKHYNYLEAETPAERKYLNAYYLLGFAMIGCAVHRDFTQRIGYIMGIASIPLLCKVFFRRRRDKKTSVGEVLPFLIGFIMVVCCAKVYYDTIVVMMQWTFGQGVFV